MTVNGFVFNILDEFSNSLQQMKKNYVNSFKDTLCGQMKLIYKLDMNQEKI